MKEGGIQVQVISLPNYGASPIHAGTVQKKLGSCRITNKTLLVLQLFNNGFYMAGTDEGGFLPVHKGP
jgi:hypothetical protein